MAIGFSYHGKLTRQQLDDYEQSYEKFHAQVERLSEKLPSTFALFGTSLPVTINVGNDGNRAAEKVQVEAKLEGPFYFSDPHDTRKGFELYLEPPKPPKPDRDPLSALVRRHIFDKPEPRRPDQFYPQESPDLNSQVDYISWRCEELRQDTWFELRTQVVGTEIGGRGVLTVTVSSAFLAKKVVLRCPVRMTGDRTVAEAPYFLRRLRQLPRPYRQRFREELEQIAP